MEKKVSLFIVRRAESDDDGSRGWVKQWNTLHLKMYFEFGVSLNVRVFFSFSGKHFRRTPPGPRRDSKFSLARVFARAQARWQMVK